MTSVFFWQNSISLCPASFCIPWPNLPVAFLTSYFCIPVPYNKTATAAKSLQSCPTLCDPIDTSLPGSSILGILQARMLEWVAIAFSNVWKWKVKVKLLSCGSQTLEHRHSSCGAQDQLPCGMWHLSRPGTIYKEKYALFMSHLLPTLLGNWQTKPLNWQADSSPLNHQRSPVFLIF